MEDMHSGIIARGGKQGVGPVEGCRPQSRRVVPKSLVGLIREIEVIPSQPLVLTAHNDVISAGVDRHTCDGTAATHQLFGQGLLGEVIDPDVVLSGDKEERLGGMEGDLGDLALVFLERVLSQCF